MNFFNRFYVHEAHISELNYTYIVFIPKVQQASHMKDFYPISLCNILYKLLSKVLCKRLRKVLPDVDQSAFVKGRLITDNSFIIQEFHNLFKNKLWFYQYMGLKLDKAYDGIE